MMTVKLTYRIGYWSTKHPRTVWFLHPNGRGRRVLRGLRRGAGFRDSLATWRHP